jgi:hypothetical protein
MRRPPQWRQVQEAGGFMVGCSWGGRLKPKVRWMSVATLVSVMDEVGLRKP